MAKKQSKRQRDIKTKLMAAIAMLLVSSIMMVSSTYAWFTLSTAPEVTGINTAVGANGNLEMALLPKDGQLTSITSAAGDSTKDIEDKNVTWGNLVDVSNSTVYGLDKITLYPAALNLTADGKVDVKGFILKTPTYGADGRVSELVANTVTSYYGGATDGFLPNDDFGVRAVGTASGMTPRQLSYRNARSAASTAMKLAANQASATLNANGSALANIAIKYGTQGSEANYDASDLVPLRKMVDDLNGVMDQIETAYMQYILAYAASAAGVAAGIDDIEWAAVEAEVNKANATLDSVIALIGGENSIPAEVKAGITAYKATAAQVAAADTELEYMEAKGSPHEFSWGEISKAVTPLANPEKMKINGFLASEVKNNISDLVSSVTSMGGLKVTLESGAGVFADVADQSEDYTASVNIAQVTVNGITLNNMNARMETDSTVNPSYLSLVGTAVERAGAPESSTETKMPISDMFGYIIDLAFRTNAAESNLLLQQEATDRIYGDNTNEETMGHGASMTFQATTTDFSNKQVRELMDAITIVFFNPADGTIYCYGALETAEDKVTIDNNGVTAKIYLYVLGEESVNYVLAGENQTPTHVEVTTYRAITGEEVGTHIIDGADGYRAITDGETGTHVVDTVTYREATADETATHVEVKTLAGRQTITDNKIMALTQNQATALSVLVYLDGNKVTNAHVAATGTTSMTGTMNLQFASSATLVPMEYSPLHIPGGNTETPETPENGGETPADPDAG